MEGGREIGREEGRRGGGEEGREKTEARLVEEEGRSDRYDWFRGEEEEEEEEEEEGEKERHPALVEEQGEVGMAKREGGVCERERERERERKRER
ncbi:hypothetical protein IE53DRAFT_390964 [Violaceomyces palustris]|uniref:Uncharacterized protein n=1 Tax=Violaceomyces palustris TaxID=1673888 RepID=A0ACD0NM39_9BASI|nr:hypothetical protein IE53DRAFT_390964 [Violaceomyces palustris]